ncbi:MAG: acetate--CoA ligase family protein, partial [Gammaproteobacteria bacterium]
FKESDQTELQLRLIEAANEMPILGPNCYGFLNYIDNVCLWPDQHGGQPVESGVAIIAQSSNISINMTMQQRSLSLAYLFTLGNQAQIGVSRVAQEMIENPKVNAIGLYLEGVDDLRDFEAVAQQARAAGKPVVVLKIGKTVKARAATVSHTASLAGGSRASSALLRRLGMVEVDSISEFLETLKLLNGLGPLPGAAVSSVSCSGGEASLMSDLAAGSSIVFRDFTGEQLERLAEVLGPRVELANPLDYHTYVWGDVPTMTRCFEAVMQSGFDLNVFVLDIPRADLCDSAGHECAIESIIAARQTTGARAAVLAMMPENLDEETSQRFLDAGAIPLHGMQTGLAAIDAAIRAGELSRAELNREPVLLQKDQHNGDGNVISEYQAKQLLAKSGLQVPASHFVNDKRALLHDDHGLRYPLALKGQGVAHKTESGVVRLGIDSAESLEQAVAEIPECADGYLLEEMIEDVVAELLLGVSFDATGVCMLTIGAGGILAELLDDTVQLLLPATRDEILIALQSLKVASLLNGYRGKPAADIDQLLDAIFAVGNYAIQNHDTLKELDINPLMAGAQQSIAADALIALRS